MNSEPDMPEGDQMGGGVNLNMSHTLLEVAVKPCQVESEADSFVMSKQDPQREEMGHVCLFLTSACGIDFDVKFPVDTLPVLFELWNQKNRLAWLHQLHHKEMGALSLHLTPCIKNSQMAMITGLN